MKTYQFVTVIGACLMLGACATPPKDVASVDAKIASLTDGDFGQFIYHQARAEEYLAKIRKARQYWVDDHYWNIDTEKWVRNAEAKAAEERKLAEEALIRWHDKCERHQEICQRLDQLELSHGKPRLPLAYFDTGSAVPKSLEQDHIEKLVKLAKDNPGLAIDLVGYTDTVGKSHDNKHLAQRRADAVSEELAKQGLPAGTVVHEVAEGEAGGPDDTPSAENRRVDARVHHTGDRGHHHHGYHHHHHK